MKKFKKALALLLSLSLVLGMIPASALTAFGADSKPVDAAVIFSDLHTSSSNYKESTVKGIFTALKNTGLPFSSVTSAGDAFSVNADSTKYTGKTSTITGYIQDVMGNIPVNYVWSDHDRYAVQADDSTLLDKKSKLVYGAGSDGEYGTSDDGNYYVYSLSMGDLCSYDRYKAGFNADERATKGFTESVTKAIQNFEADASKLNKDRPLFIVSHQPLFDRRNDNAFAEEWFDAINGVAEDMDVAFFFGHNHKYDQAEDYYYAKGDKMPVATDEGWQGYETGAGYQGYLPTGDLSSVEKELNFTHMCAGYMAPSSTGSTSSTTREGTVLAATIYEDSIQFTTYNSAGKYTGNYSVDKNVSREHAPSQTTETEVKVGDTTVVVNGATVTGSSEMKSEDVVHVEAMNYVDYRACDIEADITGNKAQLKFTVPTDWYDKTDRIVGFTVENNSVVEVEGVYENGYYTFEVDHFSAKGIALTAESVTSSGGDWVEITAPSSGTQEVTKYVYTLDTDGTVTDKSDAAVGYLIVGSGDARAMTDSLGATGVTISDDNKITLDKQPDYEWWITSDGKITDGTNYLKFTGSTSWGSPSGSVSVVTNASQASTWEIAHDGNGKYKISCDYSYSSWGSTRTATYYLRYNSNAFSVTSSSTSSSNTVRLFSGEVIGGETKGTYAKITGALSYNATTNMSADKALALVKAGIDGYSYEAMSKPGSDVVGTILNDNELTWEWVNQYNQNEPGEYTVRISYNGITLGEAKVNVESVIANNYPEYPNEGAVKVNKTATGVDFQSSGIAQVEVSASGVPVEKGVDVIVMVDTSSSMDRHIDCGEKSCNKSTCSKVTRHQELTKALNALKTEFQKKTENGDYQNIRVAFADFNGFFGGRGNTTFEGKTISNSPYALDSSDYTDAAFSATGSTHIIQGSTIDYNAFMTPAQLSDVDFGEFVTKSGTNYDYALDVIYQLGHAAKKHNLETGENRDLKVIFMTDGAANQFNYYGAVGGSSGSSKLWDNWLLGSWKASDLTSSNLNCTEHSYYYDLNDHDGDGFVNEHRMANAIKGDPNKTYEVIRKSTAGLEDILPDKSNDNLYNVPGLGATMYAIAFAPSNDGDIDEASMIHSVKQIASDQTDSTQYYYEVEASAGLDIVFKGIGNEIAYAANNARFVDQMGDDYNLQMEVSDYSVVDETTNTTTGKTITPKIEIISYDIYTKADADAGNIPSGKNVGDRKGTFKVLETVTFNTDGSEAYSDKKSGNILVDGVIKAQTFYYNTNATAVTVEGISIPTGKNSSNLTTGSTNVLPAETFYWKLGTVQTSELAMRYYVYLEGSMEGTREGGSYPTNEYATLYYDNYLENPCYKDTVSPVMAWDEANVSYAFYLVNEKGEIIVNQTTGAVGSFANKVAVTNPVVYETIKLNNLDEISSIEVASAGVLPEGYELYDTSAKYTITINSNTTGSWGIEKADDKVASTYVTQYKTDDASAYSNALTNSTVGDDYTHTVVWFAVLWKVQALPDTVVIDYGLPVDISVLANDMFGENGRLAGVGAFTAGLNLNGHDTALTPGFASSYASKFGIAKVDTTGKVRFTPKDMQMNGYEKFAYAVNYTGNKNAGYYYDTVTVIPATTIYYEDSFVEYDNLTWTSTGTNAWEGEWTVVEAPETSVWTKAGETITGATQEEDRPGQYSLTDANNIYGYDSVNNNMATYSLGSAMKATVKYNHAAQASFKFYGTGFDVISMTDSTTGTILVDVYDVKTGEIATYNDGTTCSFSVDTYYGYMQNDNGEWVVNPDAEDAIYQVPVMKVENLPYGNYEVVIRAVYDTIFDHETTKTPETYDFYLDAIRIYDPANNGTVDNDTIIEEAYKADGEGWPSYIELRNKIIAASSFDNVANDALTTDIEGLVFIDGDASVGDAQISDYISYGPNNEIYLAPGQRVAFMLNTPENIANVHIGIKSADGKTGTYTITNIAKATNSETGVTAGDYYGAKTATVNTATDMYYDLTGWKNDIIVISNTGDDYNTTGIISITNIKSTYTSDPNGVMTVSLEDELSETETSIYMTPEAATLTLRTLNTPVEEDTPEVDVPEKPGDDPAVEPEEPGADENESVSETVNKIVNTIANAVKKLFGWLFV